MPISLPLTDAEIRLVARARLPTRFATFESFGFFDVKTQREVIALVLGQSIFAERAPLLRIHSQCLTGDVFASQRCDCRPQLQRAMELIAADGAGLLLYEFDEGRGIGILNKLRAYELQDAGLDTVDANVVLGLPVDARTYETSVAIIKWFGLRSVRLLTNNPDKLRALRHRSINVERVSLITEVAPEADRYVATKRTRLGHEF